ncbi:conserved hypothetical protein [Mucor ambiguus]|uniref:UBX domain-containing protein n=1 Tax=Mucor ambiguus TaxID=91626 RepID=A0A0C9LQ43_9FUNG|nr:conserved hypothetical protein [Mucor ambiguus]
MTLNDSNLAYLLSLGFEIELCRQALQQNSTLEDATEWILNPSRPPASPVNTLDYSKPIASSSTLSAPPKISIEKKQKDDQVTKEMQKKKFDRIANDLKRERTAEREARRKALIDIKEDRESRKLRGHTKPNTTQTIQPPTSTAKPGEPTADKDQFAFIQFKWTDSTTLRQKFPPNTKMMQVLEFVKEKEAKTPNAAIENISLISTFPKRIYTVQDAALDMREAGFLPNVTLNVNIAAPITESQEEEEAEMAEMMEENEEEEEEEDNVMEDGVNNSEEEDDINAMDLDIARAIDPHRPPVHNVRRIWGRVGAGHHLTDPSPVVNTSEIVETTAVPESNAHADQEATNRRRSNILTAMEQRASVSTATNIPSHQQHALERHTKSLRETCSNAVAGRFQVILRLLSQHSLQMNSYLKHLDSVSSEVAESLLEYLAKSGKLNATTMRKLADHCYLQNIKLDSYTYCTDSLIGDLARSNSTVSVTKLSLRGCDVITDNGIRALTGKYFFQLMCQHILKQIETGLKNLGYLDVNNCKVTDKGLKSLENLHHLYHLNLSKTKITDQGIASMVANSKFRDQLEVLLLDGCTRVKSSRLLVPIVNGFENLLQLSVANTGLPKQEMTAKLSRDRKLEQLDLTNTYICDDDLIQIISQITTLVELKMSGCDNCLKWIQFPDRELELDGVLSRFKDLPLEHLDLTGFLNVTDEGAKQIAEMKHLRYLSLDGTKVTDAGLEMLKDLIELEKLYLDRTSITDKGLSQLIGLSKLDTLSLCHTKVSNVFLKLLGNFERTSFTRNLRTLNLAKCPLVTNKGVRHLSGTLNLTNLNLDHTSVSRGCLKYLKDLQHLKPVRLQGILNESDQEDELDDDDGEMMG